MNNKKILSVFLSGAIALSSNLGFATEGSSWYTKSVNYGQTLNLVPADINVLNSIDYNYAINSIFRIENAKKAIDKDPVAWAVENGLVSAEAKLDAKLTRSELAKVMVNYAKVLKLELNDAKTGIEKVADFKDIKAEFVNDMALAYNLNIMKGNEVGKLNPNEETNMAEFLTVLLNISTIKTPEIKEETTEAVAAIAGKVESVSKYGNITTSIKSEDFKAKGFELGDLVKVTVGEKEVVAPFGDAYSNVDNHKEIITQDNDKGKIAVAINMGNFSETYSATEGVEVAFELAEKAGYKEEYEIRSIDKYRTLNREDYGSDEIFANFRPIKMGKIADGVLFRTSSPINPEINRAAFANDLVEKHGVATVMNMADSKEELEGYFKADTFKSPYYKSLYENGKVVYLDMGVDFTSEDFHKKLNKGLVFLSEQEGPFAIHCNEGKDRAGFASIVLEGLMGGSVDEIREDYMVSFINYYFVEKDSKQYDKIAESNVMKSLKMIAGVETEEELRQVNLEEKTEKYLEEVIGMNKEQIKKLKEVLSKEIVAKKAA